MPLPLEPSNAVTLVTAFDAFGGMHVNPSAELVMQLGLADKSLSTAVLPTSYARAWDAMQKRLSAKPRRIVMFGFSRHAEGLRLERYARNGDRSLDRDNDGRSGQAKILDSAPAVLRTSAPVDELCRRLGDARIPAYVSEDAGGFVCNHIYFLTLDALEKAIAPDASCLFVHVGDWQSASNRADIVRGAKLLVAALEPRAQKAAA